MPEPTIAIVDIVFCGFLVRAAPFRSALGELTTARNPIKAPASGSNVQFDASGRPAEFLNFGRQCCINPCMRPTIPPRHLALFLSLISAMAIVSRGSTVLLRLPGGEEHLDSECSTNAVIHRGMLEGIRILEGEMSLFATPSNAVEIAFGASDCGDLPPGGESFSMGWRGGVWFFASGTERVESQSICNAARRTLSFSLRVAQDGSPMSLSLHADDVGNVFDSLVSSPPTWLFSREWNVARLTIRGIDATDESVSVRFLTDPGMMLLR